MADKRRGLGKGLGALIPSGPQSIPHTDRPVDLLFRERTDGRAQGHRNPLIPLGNDDDSAADVEEVAPVGQGTPSSGRQAASKRKVPDTKVEGKKAPRSGGSPSLSRKAVPVTPQRASKAPVSRETSRGGGSDGTSSSTPPAASGSGKSTVEAGVDTPSARDQGADTDAAPGHDLGGLTRRLAGTEPDQRAEPINTDLPEAQSDVTLDDPPSHNSESPVGSRDAGTSGGVAAVESSGRADDAEVAVDAQSVEETGIAEDRGELETEQPSARSTHATGSEGGDRVAGGAVGPDLVAVPGAAFIEVPVDQIRVNPRQPRTVFDEEALEELRQSILQVGILQPIVVRSVPGESGYELIMGERRWRASQAAGLDRIPAIVRDTSDDDLLRDALLENLHRSNLNPLEEAAAYDQLLTDFGCTHEELAGRIGRSRPQISNTIRLLRLPALVQRRVAAGVLSSGHARALLSLADPAAMERLAQRIVAEGLSVRATEEIVSMGTAEATAPRTRRPATRFNEEALNVITTRLSDALETRVSAAMSKRKGRLTIEFADMDDLNRILTGLAPTSEENDQD